MRRVAVILVVVAVCALSGTGHAADLQAGWYADISHVYIYTYGDMGPRLVGNAYFYNTPPGQYGPFQVTDGPGHTYSTRNVSVPTDFPDAQQSDSLTMPVYIPLSQGTPIAYMGMGWETNYDPGGMNLQLWHTSSTGASSQLWTQSLGGLQYGGYVWAYDTILDGYYSLRIAIVPEPCTLLPLASGLLAAATYLRRRK